MSALGQKQTCALHHVMSASPPKATAKADSRKRSCPLYPLWKLYSRSDDAVCIQSTYRRLCGCLPKVVRIGKVSYINYETEGFSEEYVFNYIMHKRKSFEHERELRAVFWTMDTAAGAEPLKEQIESSGLQIKVNLNELIETVFVSPSAAPWFASLVVAMTKKCGFDFPVKHSGLDAKPLYWTFRSMTRSHPCR